MRKQNSIIVWSLLSLLAFLSSCAQSSSVELGRVPRPAIEFSPRLGSCPRASGPILVDGRATEDSWVIAPWTEDFVDIEGPAGTSPRWRTRARMLWDDHALHIFAELESPHLWAKVTERDDVVYRDPDFEIFIDPDGDSHGYYEIEVNVIGTVWDLRLSKPYLDGGVADNEWDCEGLEVAIEARGTVGDPRDRDLGWSVEMSIPFSALAEGRPQVGERWRLNFARVEWETEIVAGDYRRILDPDRPEWLQPMNWCWSPQGMVNMHRPEMWGIVEFQDAPSPPVMGSEERAHWLLRRLYYAARADSSRSPDPGDMVGEVPDGWRDLVIAGRGSDFRASLGAPDGRRLEIRHDGSCAYVE